MLFTGSMVAIVTPFKKGKVDEEALCKLVDFQIASGTSAIVPCGTTGESATLSHQEHDQVIEVVVKHAKKRVKVIAGAGSNSTSEAIRLHQFCQKVGADGALHITPYYNKPTQAGLLQHFQAIAKSADIPVVLYNVPSRTGVNMTAETTIQLSQIDTVVGIKEASGDLFQVTDIINGTGDEFSMISGEDGLTYLMYCLGGNGVISVTANIEPKKSAALYQAMQDQDLKKALALHNDLMPLHNALFAETNPIPVKAALALMGYIEEEYRLPLVAMTAQNREILKQCLKDKGLIF